MIGLTLESVQEAIIDAPKIVRAMQRTSEAALKRFGAFVRQTALKSMRKGKGISDPGSAPASHLGLIKNDKLLLFAVEASQDNVIIGPIKLNRTSPTALAALEHGGMSMVLRKGKPIQIMVRARPFMQPAFDLEMAKTGGPAKLWENQLKE